uniref:Reverse transcriptase domain-containing protein n=1 Tax=Tanacetum cinerariifolium TaxID=118510 RepID=A0A6L2KPD0_TANCI|nr:reverse transcriptase domain-containing protein [Tanacetum cinerariifolium]
MRTRSSFNLPVESPPNPSTSNPKRRNRRRLKQPFILEESPIYTMADQRTMAEFLRAPTEGYAEAIVVPPILAEQFKLKHSLINMMISNQFFRLEKDNPHDHIHLFNKITSTIKYKDVPNSTIKLMLFPFSLVGAAHRWLEKEPTRSILTWRILFQNSSMNSSPSRTTNLRNEILNFQQQFDESFHEAWDRYKDLLRACPHHSFTELHQLDTYYNALNPVDQDSLNSVAGGNLLERRTQDVLTIIENKFKVPQFSKQIGCFSMNQQTSDVTTAMTAILKQFQATSPPASVKSVEEICVTCGGAHPYYQCLAADDNTFPKLRDNIQGYVAATSSGSLPSNTNANPKGELKAITTRSGIDLGGPFVPILPPFINPKEDEHVEETLTDQDLAEVPLILGRPFLRTARALIDVHCEEMILRNGDERLTLNMRHDTSSYSNQPQKESINLINVFNDSNLDSTKYLHPPHHVSTTSSSSPNQLLEEFVDELALITFSSRNDDLPFDIESNLKEIEYLLHHDPIKDIDSILKDSINQSNLAYLNDNLVDSIPKMFTDEHALDYSSPSLYDEYDDDLFKVESDTEYVYDDPFDSNGEKIKESKLLINKLNLLGDFLLSSEYDSFLSEDFFKVDALPSTNNEDKVFNPGILIQENLFKVITRVAPEKNEKKLAICHASLILEDFDTPLYELPCFKEVPMSKILFLFSSKNKGRVFKPRTLTSKKVHSSLIPELSHQGYKVFKIY